MGKVEQHSAMTAKVSSYGGEQTGGFRTVQHWQLEVNGQFIADTSSPKQADLFREIADRVERGGSDDEQG